MPRLKRWDPTRPGLTRVRRGKGFQYLDTFGQTIQDPETIARIRSLVIPPAWSEVWICPYPNGHIQAVGYDAAGRKQYLYHPHWRTLRDQMKFQHMIEFAHSLPDLRRHTRQCLMVPDMGREKVLAAAIRMLDRGLFRMGSEQYAAKNATYGVATILKSHVKLGPEYQITFDFIAKHNKRQVHTIVDPDIYELVQTLKRRRTGSLELLAFKQDGAWYDVKSTDINGFLQEVTGGDFTAKDFRTWAATVMAEVSLAGKLDAQSATAKKRAVAATVREVSEYLGNTPAVCRSSYIYPRIIDDYLAGVTIAPALEMLDPAQMGEWEFREAVDAAVLSLIEGEQVGRKVA
ncbi:MAG TPA: DNA topoisomerase IB [Actinomycetota bacterium]|nr:DNA topoisomerase IB [Actinomycetota bacterium]